MRVLRLPEVLDRTGLGRATLYRKIAAGDFPGPLKITRVLNGWREDEVDEWIDSRPRAAIGPEAAA